MYQAEEQLPTDRVISAEEAVAYKKRTARSDGKVWRWAGNAADERDAAFISREPPAQTNSEVMFNCNPNGTVAMWLYY